MNLAGAAGHDNAVAYYLRHGIRSGARAFGVRICEWIIVFVLPDRSAGGGLESGDHIFGLAAKGGVQHAVFFSDGGVAVAQGSAPEFFRTGRRPGVGETGSIR